MPHQENTGKYLQLFIVVEVFLPLDVHKTKHRSRAGIVGRIRKLKLGGTAAGIAKQSIGGGDKE